MTIIFILFCIVCLYNAKFCSDNSEYLSRKNTQIINGIFAFLIFLSHFVSYLEPNIPLSSFYLDVRSFLKQLVVVTFLFYSGYGMFESFKKKGSTYIQSIPNRFLKLLFRFDLAILLFLVLAIILKEPLTIKRVFFSFLAWQGLGNSYWYVFIVLCLYVIMYFVFKIFHGKIPLSLMMFTLGALILSFAFIYIEKPAAWYNTIFSFVAGMWFSYYKDKFESFINRSTFCYGISLGCIFSTFIVLHSYMDDSLFIYELVEILFCILIVLLSKKVILNNPLLKWLGNHVFSFYILQRIPMIVGDKLGMNRNFIIYFLMCLVSSVLLSHYFDLLTSKLEKYIFSFERKKLQ